MPFKKTLADIVSVLLRPDHSALLCNTVIYRSLKAWDKTPWPRTKHGYSPCWYEYVDVDSCLWRDHLKLLRAVRTTQIQNATTTWRGSYSRKHNFRFSYLSLALSGGNLYIITCSFWYSQWKFFLIFLICSLNHCTINCSFHWRLSCYILMRHTHTHTHKHTDRQNYLKILKPWSEQDMRLILLKYSFLILNDILPHCGTQ